MNQDRKTNQNQTGRLNDRHCFRCLLEEMDPDLYRRDIDRVLKLMDRDQKVRDQEYARRLSICKDCDYLYQGTCNACGCFVELRAAAKSGHCTYKKW